MGSPSTYSTSRKDAFIIIFSLTVLTLFALVGVISADEIQDRAVAPAVITSTKTSNKSAAGVGETIKYTIQLKNSGGAFSGVTTMTDTLPANLTYVAGSLDTVASTALSEPGYPIHTAGVIEWKGLVGPGGSIDITFDALVGSGAVLGTTITNTAQIEEVGGVSLSPEVAFSVVTPTLPSNMPNSSKSADVEAALNDEIDYTITLSNSTGATITNIWMTDTLPAGLTYVANSIEAPAILGVIPSPGYPKVVGNVISWNGIIGGGVELPISFSAILTGSYTIGDVVTNTAIIEESGASLTVSAATTVITKSTGAELYMPIMHNRYPNLPEEPTLNEINETDARDGTYTVAWPSADFATGYVLEEDDNADFSSPSTVYSGSGTSWTVPSAKSNDTYYYRVKATNSAGDSRWSNTVSAQVVTFYTEDTTIDVDTCTRLIWEFENISSIHIVFGIGYDQTPVDGDDRRLVCPSRTTTFEAHVEYPDGSEEVFETTVTVNYDDEDDCGRDPIVSQFEPSKNNIEPNEEFDMTWDVTCARAIHYRVGSSGSYTPAGGQYTLEDIEIEDDTTIWLRVKRADEAFIFITERIYVND